MLQEYMRSAKSRKTKHRKGYKVILNVIYHTIEVDNWIAEKERQHVENEP